MYGLRAYITAVLPLKSLMSGSAPCRKWILTVCASVPPLLSPEANMSAVVPSFDYVFTRAPRASSRLTIRGFRTWVIPLRNLSRSAVQKLQAPGRPNSLLPAETIVGRGVH